MKKYNLPIHAEKLKLATFIKIYVSQKQILELKNNMSK